MISQENTGNSKDVNAVGIKIKNQEFNELDDYSFSVVICTYSFDRLDDLDNAIQSIQIQSPPPKEIIVVVDHNDDLLHHLGETYPKLVVTANQNSKGLSGGRNTGVSVAKGDMIIFLDDDAIAAPNWIEKHLSRYGDENVVAVGSKIEPLWQQGRPNWFPEEFDWVVGGSYRGLPETIQSVNKVMGCTSVRKEVFEEIGGFSSNLGRIGDVLLSGEESEFWFRIKTQWEKAVILYDPEARVQHQVPPARAKWSYFRRRCFFGGVSNFVLVRMVGAKIGLEAERQFVLKTLTLGALRYLGEGLGRKGTYGIQKALVLVIGFALTLAGYIWAFVYSKLARRKFERLIYG